METEDKEREPLGQQPTTPGTMAPPSRGRGLLRELPRHPRDIQNLRRDLTALLAAVCLHALTFTTLGLLEEPSTEMVRLPDTAQPLAQLDIAFIQPQEKPEEPPPAPVAEPDLTDLAKMEMPEKLPELDRLELTPPPRPTPPPVRRRVRRRTRRPVPSAPVAPAAQPSARAITSTAEDAPTGGDEVPANPPTEVASAPEGSVTQTVSAPVANPEEEGVDRGALLRQYRGVIARTVHRKYVYPRNAIRAGLQGRVIVEIMVDGEGNITSRKVIQSSGHAVLDRAALEAISRIEKLPRPPSALHWTARAMRLPFVYELRS